jgi:hypothetical protein
LSTGFISLRVGTKERGSYDNNNNYNVHAILKQTGEFLD